MQQQKAVPKSILLEDPRLCWWQCDRQYTITTVNNFLGYIQGVPKKMSFLGKIAITTLKLIQNANVGGVLENSGYLLPHGHWDFQNWRRNDWENEASSCQPPSKTPPTCPFLIRLKQVKAIFPQNTNVFETHCTALRYNITTEKDA